MSTITATMNPTPVSSNATLANKKASATNLSIKKILSVAQSIQQRINSRQALLRLTPEQLDDAGISKAQAYKEAQKPFWK